MILKELPERREPAGTFSGVRSAGRCHLYNFFLTFWLQNWQVPFLVPSPIPLAPVGMLLALHTATQPVSGPCPTLHSSQVATRPGKYHVPHQLHATAAVTQLSWASKVCHALPAQQPQPSHRQQALTAHARDSPWAPSSGGQGLFASGSHGSSPIKDHFLKTGRGSSSA